ncbi:MAG TPA: glycosyltransferase family 2 protein [Tepidisphaeraceae bacterium]|nr:glycosyltransferase family 2 protein [Tepidisphaeraceae bacterium]
MKLLIVIVNYKTADLAIDCLRSLVPEIGHDPGVRVVITDNKSDDDSVARLNSFISQYACAAKLELQPLDHNGGFAFGNNRAIEPSLAQKPDYVLLLNPDTRVHPGAIQALVEFMDRHDAIGIAGSRLEDPDGTPQRSAFRFPTISSEFERGIRLGFVSRMLAAKVVAPPVPEQTSPTDWVAGASMIIRPAVFEAIGLMDEKYFMYFEEVDFCLQAKRAGWPCWYVPSSRVVHLVGAASELSDARKHRKRRPKYWFDSRRRYFVKNHGIIYAALADLAFAVGFALWRVRRFIQRKQDTDPPKMLSDFIRNSVFLRGGAQA